MRAHDVLTAAAVCIAGMLASANAAKAAAPPDALLYIAVDAANEIAIFPRSHSRQLIGTITKGIAGPSALATDRAGTLYVENNNNTITAYPLGATSPSLTYSQGVSGPSFLATGPDGSLYVANSTSRSVVQFPPGSTTPVRTITFKQAPGGITVNRAGDLFVVIGTDIFSVSPGQTHGHSLDFSLPENGEDLAIDRHGNFLVNLPDFGLDVFARARPHAQLAQYGLIYNQQGRFTIAPDDDGLYLVDTTDNRVVQIAYPDDNYANVIGNLPGYLGGVAVTRRHYTSPR